MCDSFPAIVGTEGIDKLSPNKRNTNFTIQGTLISY